MKVPPDAFLSPALPCSGLPASIAEGRKSFPSGHSSFAFVTWGFVFLYLSGKLGTFR
jgi:membrane-associated phospholipid phosphatase